MAKAPSIHARKGLSARVANRDVLISAASVAAKNEAIHELAHVAEALLEQLRTNGDLPGILDEAVGNKIDYYRNAATIQTREL